MSTGGFAGEGLESLDGFAGGVLESPVELVGEEAGVLDGFAEGTGSLDGFAEGAIGLLAGFAEGVLDSLTGVLAELPAELAGTEELLSARTIVPLPKIPGVNRTRTDINRRCIILTN
jgi:hypothetical protein